MMPIIYAFIFIMGLCVGSFLNVLIYRIPAGEEFVKTPSHCLSCGHRLAWFENIPLVSYILQGGRCRSCGVKLSVQYTIIEAVNGLAWLFTALLYHGQPFTCALYCLAASALLALSVIDWRTFTIPNGFQIFLLALGAVNLLADLAHWRTYVAGALIVSLFFLLLYIVTGGRGIGMGDIKLIAAAGLLLGWQKILLATCVGSLLGSVIHIIRMKRSGEGAKLAFGPYLSCGIWIAMVFGEKILRSYLSIYGL
ncbi:MAG: prepilin peptidase [Clostridia bacterium]|nr:prepilin peptidase [Clostridia bacterium]